MGKPTTWCYWSHLPVEQCQDHASGHPHKDVVSQLGPDDEPRTNGALVLVWADDYQWQEVWVASGANIGNWYCLGGEFGRPKVWDPPRRDLPLFRDVVDPPRPTGTIPVQPDWFFVLTRGPVVLLTWDHQEAYADGWRNGRRRLYETIAEDDTGAYGQDGQ